MYPPEMGLVGMGRKESDSTKFMTVAFLSGFPASVSVKQKYRLLGNSLNVHVVSELMNCLLQSPS